MCLPTSSVASRFLHAVRLMYAPRMHCTKYMFSHHCTCTGIVTNKTKPISQQMMRHERWGPDFRTCLPKKHAVLYRHLFLSFSTCAKTIARAMANPLSVSFPGMHSESRYLRQQDTYNSICCSVGATKQKAMIVRHDHSAASFLSKVLGIMYHSRDGLEKHNTAKGRRQNVTRHLLVLPPTCTCFFFFFFPRPGEQDHPWRRLRRAPT